MGPENLPDVARAAREANVTIPVHIFLFPYYGARPRPALLARLLAKEQLSCTGRLFGLPGCRRAPGARRRRAAVPRPPPARVPPLRPPAGEPWGYNFDAAASLQVLVDQLPPELQLEGFMVRGGV